ncbi:MAG: RNA methyltransferase [Anaerolineae bacterium]|nr:RNA methyltransferase [Anaerolineae bacterium]
MPELLEEFLPRLPELQMTQNRLQRLVKTACKRQRGLMLLMEDVHNEHNLAAISRSCDAFGVQQVAFTLENPDHFNPSRIPQVTARGAAKWLDYRIFTDGTTNALQTLHSEGWHLLATSLHPGARPLHTVDFTQYEKLVLMVGNEHAGLSPAALEHADQSIYIPMQGFTQSFNVSVAAALCLYEITRQRNASPVDFRISLEDARSLVEDFLQR